jgi:hypothetical protein
MIERGHRPIKDTLVKMCGQSGGKWREYLPLVLFPDRISTKRTTGFTPYGIIFGQLPVLPVGLEMDTYLGVDWLAISTTEELLEARTNQLERKDEIIEEAHQKLLKARENSVRYWDRKIAARLRNPLDPGDLVLVYKKVWRTSGASYFPTGGTDLSGSRNNYPKALIFSKNWMGQN